MRRSYDGLDLYLGDDLIARKAKVVHDPNRGVVVISEKIGPRGRWVETRTFENMTGPTHSKVGKEMVYTWTGDVTVTGVKEGCGCGGKR